MKKQFLDTEGLSEYLPIGKSTIYKKVAKNEIPFHKVGTKTLFDVDEIDTWVRSNGSVITATKKDISELKGFLD